MALQIKELFLSGRGGSGRNAWDEYTCIVWGTPADNADDPFTIVTFALGEFGTISEFGNVFSDFQRERIAPCTWKVTATYKAIEDNRQTNDASFSFSTGGGTQHISYSRKTVTAYAGTGMVKTNTGSQRTTFKAPNFRGAINVGPDGSVGGVDVQVPAFNFKTTFYVAPSNMTENFVQELKACTASVNNDQVQINVDGIVQSFQPGELLLLGADGQKRIGFGDWELGLSWSASANVTGLSIGDDGTGGPAITGIAKNGWDYLWVYFGASTPDANAFALVKPPQAAYVEQIYPYNALSGLLPATSFGASNVQPWTNPISPGTPGAGLFGLDT